MYSAGLFISCMFFHGELVKRKPASRHLTSFYLMISLGGALGGFLVGVVAPNVLPPYFELPITLMGCCVTLLLVLEYRQQHIIRTLGWATAAAVILASGYYMSAYGQKVRVMSRNFYGGLRVNEYNKERQMKSVCLSTEP